MIRNFLFHRVNPKRELLWGPMEINLFKKHIAYIHKKYDVVLLEDMLQENFPDSNKKLATIAFDDGYKDNIEYAADILDKYKLKASFYVVTDCIEKDIPIWTHILDFSFEHTRIAEIDLNFSFLPVECRVGFLESRKARIEYVKKLKPALKKLSHSNKDEVISRVTAAFKDVELPKLMMNWNDLAALKLNGHYIGSHTISHPILDTMDDEKELKRELSGSGEMIKSKLGYFPVSIAYPNGNYNEKVMSLSKEAGYKLGLTVKEGMYDPQRDSAFEIPRIVLYNEPWWKARLRLSTRLQDIKKLIGYK